MDYDYKNMLIWCHGWKKSNRYALYYEKKMVVISDDDKFLLDLSFSTNRLHSSGLPLCSTESATSSNLKLCVGLKLVSIGQYVRTI
jgi:hypothetical protein